jgi:anti-sigma-K factor RskA
MNLWRTIVATAILAVWAGVIIEGAIRGRYEAPVAAMTPVAAVAAGYLFGRDAIEVVLSRRDGRRDRRSEPPRTGEDRPDEAS